MSLTSEIQAASGLETIMALLFAQTDELKFFAQLSLVLKNMLGEEHVEISRIFADQSSKALARDGVVIQSTTLWTRGDSVSSYVAKLKRPYYSNNVKRDPLFAKIQAHRNFVGEVVETELAFPLQIEGQVIATIHLQSENLGRQYSDKDYTSLKDALESLRGPIENIYRTLMVKEINQEIINKIDQNQKLNAAVIKSEEYFSVEEIIGQDRRILDAIKLVDRAAKEEFPVLLEGALGTGKRLFSRRIHSLSNRSDKPIMVFECAVKEEISLEKELFGTSDRQGILELSNGGTLILSDVGDLPMNLQVRLLQFLTTGQLVKNNGRDRISLNVRFVAASKRPLRDLVAEKKFREDLFYRLSTISITLPSLSERLEDIKILADHFLNLGKREKKYLTNNVMQKLAQHQWVANVLELKSIMERAYMLADGAYIESIDLNIVAQETTVIESKGTEAVNLASDQEEITLFDLEKKHIVKVLERLSGNKTKAAKSLGITVKTLYNKLHAYGMFDNKENEMIL